MKIRSVACMATTLLFFTCNIFCKKDSSPVMPNIFRIKSIQQTDNFSCGCFAVFNLWHIAQALQDNVNLTTLDLSTKKYDFDAWLQKMQNSLDTLNPDDMFLRIKCRYGIRLNNKDIWRLLSLCMTENQLLQTHLILPLDKEDLADLEPIDTTKFKPLAQDYKTKLIIINTQNHWISGVVTPDSVAYADSYNDGQVVHKTYGIHDIHRYLFSPFSNCQSILYTDYSLSPSSDVITQSIVTPKEQFFPETSFLCERIAQSNGTKTRALLRFHVTVAPQAFDATIMNWQNLLSEVRSLKTKHRFILDSNGVLL